MISKVMCGHNFSGSIRYILNDQKKAEILKVEGVRSHSKKLMIADFVRQHQSRPQKTLACFHSVLSFAHGDRPGNSEVVAAAERYLAALKIVNTQFAIVKHSDTKHLHVHIIANMVDYSGNSISDKWIGLRGKKAAQQITKELELTPAVNKHIAITNLPNLRPPDRHKYEIYQAIVNVLPGCTCLEHLSKRLQVRGVGVNIKVNSRTMQPQGISFSIGDFKFKGSAIDRQFSLRNIEQTLTRQRVAHLALPTRPTFHHSNHSHSASAIPAETVMKLEKIVLPMGAECYNEFQFEPSCKPVKRHKKKKRIF